LFAIALIAASSRGTGSQASPHFWPARQQAERQRLAACLIVFSMAADRLVSVRSIGPTKPPRMRIAYLDGAQASDFKG
jgi:hypothetical protein